MSKKNLFLFFGALALLGSGFFVWYYGGKTWLQLDAQEKQIVASEESQLDAEENKDEGESVTVLETSGTTESADQSRMTLSDTACETECQEYQGNGEELGYCQAVCGLPSEEGGARSTPTNCETFTATQKDICLKDKAVAEGSQEGCASITDRNLRQSCYNRIAEERFDK